MGHNEGIAWRLYTTFLPFLPFKGMRDNGIFIWILLDLHICLMCCMRVQFFVDWLESLGGDVERERCRLHLQEMRDTVQALDVDFKGRVDAGCKSAIDHI